jgi:hypothetical protein
MGQKLRVFLRPGDVVELATKNMGMRRQKMVASS